MNNPLLNIYISENGTNCYLFSSQLTFQTRFINKNQQGTTDKRNHRINKKQGIASKKNPNFCQVKRSLHPTAGRLHFALAKATARAFARLTNKIKTTFRLLGIVSSY